jgi:hypothetical protein
MGVDIMFPKTKLKVLNKRNTKQPRSLPIDCGSALRREPAHDHVQIQQRSQSDLIPVKNERITD